MKILIKIYNWIIKMAKKVLNLDTDTGAESWGSVNADNVVLDTTNFDKNLDTTITDVQKLADAVDDLVLGGLPEGTVNQTLRHNGTGWVATANSTLTDGNTNIEFKLVNNTLPTKKYISMKNTSESSELFVQANKSLEAVYSRYCGMVSNEYTSQVMANTQNNEFVRMYATNNDKCVQLKPDGASNNQQINIQTTKTYSATSKIFEFVDKFQIYQNGKIVSNYLSGTGSSLIEALPDGTMQRSTQAIPSAQVNTDWDATSGVAELLNKPVLHKYKEFLSERLTVVSDGYGFSNTQLGLDGVNLNEKVKMVQCYVIQADYPNVKNNELVMGHNIEDGQISVRLNFNLAVGDRIKIYLEYID